MTATYLKKAAEVIRSYGGLFIADEVQAGFGRAGEHWFAVQHFEVEPDIMVMAKGIAGGFPAAATITSATTAASCTRNSAAVSYVIEPSGRSTR